MNSTPELVKAHDAYKAPIQGIPMNDTKPHWRKRKRVHMMMWAMLHHGIKDSHNNMLAWMYLLEWARLGGKREEWPR